VDDGQQGARARRPDRVRISRIILPEDNPFRIGSACMDEFVDRVTELAELDGLVRQHGLVVVASIQEPAL
jgi:hypothetical protein